MNEIQPPRRKTSPLSTIRATLEVVTPIYGGSFEPRTIDEIDIIRPASVRGHLRFWWRALYGHAFAESRELYARESEIWGAAGGEGRGGRSQVELRIAVVHRAAKDQKSLGALDANPAYALFPARAQAKDGIPEAERRAPGTRFEVMLRTPPKHVDAVRCALQAWLLFGGYGGRTRRGLGSLRLGLPDSPDLQLPAAATDAALEAVFGVKLIGAPSRPTSVPSLLGARWHVRVEKDEISAWHTSLGWLRYFRQGHDRELSPALRAREPAPKDAKEPDRPSRSKWPEPDKVRHLARRGLQRWAHEPEHGDQPAWPRASFGLPIIGRFQDKSRDRVSWHEPKSFEITWFEGKDARNRLASPLIVKPLPLTNRRFAAMALWLCRAQPPGTVGLKDVPKSHAPFDRLLGQGDEPRFAALAGKANLQDAFFTWLELADPELVKIAASKPGSKKPSRNKPNG